MPDDFFHRCQLLSIRINGFSADLSDAAAHQLDEQIRAAFNDHPHFANEGMARHLTKEWCQTVTEEQVKVARTQPERFRMVFDRAQRTRNDLQDLLSKVCSASKQLPSEGSERSLFLIIKSIMPLIDELFDEGSLAARAKAVGDWSPRLSREVEAIGKQRSQTLFDRSLPDEVDAAEPPQPAPSIREPAAGTDVQPSQTLAELVAQFLREADWYLATWNLFQTALSLAKPIKRLWQGGTVVTPPSEKQLETIERRHSEYLDWGVKMAATGQRLAECLIANDRDPEGVLKIVHRARGGGGGAARVVEIWESVKTKLQAIVLQDAMDRGDDSPTKREKTESVPTDTHKRLVATPPMVNAAKPLWDPGRKTLSFDGIRVKKFRNVAKNQFLVLESFTEQDWRTTIDDPLPKGGKKEVDAVQRVQDTAKSLNGGMECDSPIRFSTNGSGTGFAWHRAK